VSALDRSKARASLIPIVGLMYASACGGPYGMEDWVARTGPGLFILLLFTLPWIWGVPMALASAEMSTRYPTAGGFYRWAQEYLGDFWGYQAGMWSLLSSFLDNALYPVLFARALAHLNPDMTALERWLAAVAFIGVFTYLNFRGIRIAGGTAVVLNLFLIAPFLWLIVVGLLKAQFNPFVPFAAPGASLGAQVGGGLALAMWLYSGYYEVSTVAEEVEDPSRVIPRAIGLVTPLVVLSYSLPTLAALAVVGGWQTWESGQFTSVGRAAGGPLLGNWLFLGSVASYSVIFLAYLLWWSRLAWAMADDGRLPKLLNRLHPRFGTPHRVLVVYALVYSVMAILPFEDLLVADSWLAGAYTMLVYASLIRARQRETGPRPGFCVPGGTVGLWLTALVPAATWILMLALTAWEQVWLGLGFLLAGPALYLLTRVLRRPAAIG
jgi:amino acid transporter